MTQVENTDGTCKGIKMWFLISIQNVYVKISQSLFKHLFIYYLRYKKNMFRQKKPR